ncbi:MAG: hypothetical protein WCS31_08190 [Verrucomicrobiae bacterium]
MSDKNLALETAFLRIELDGKGEIVVLRSKADGLEYLPVGQCAPLLSVRCGGVFERPSRLEQNGDILKLSFAWNQVEAEIKAVANADYLSFEVVKISNHDKVELILWGPYPTIIKETIGDLVGVVRDQRFAIGIQSLNMKTLGGYPANENDRNHDQDWRCDFDKKLLMASPWVDTIRADVITGNSFLLRGGTAEERDFGSILQCFCRNRDKERIVDAYTVVGKNPDQESFVDCFTDVGTNPDVGGKNPSVAPAFHDGGVVGSKIALFGCPTDEALPIIGRIELAEGLPHPMIDGEWARTSRRANESYVSIRNFCDYSFEESLELTEKMGLKLVYFKGLFETWGHFILEREFFPENWKSLKQLVDTARVRGIDVGAHNLSNFITPNDAYVTPVPDKRLAKVGSSVLTADISAEATEIPIAAPHFFNQTVNNLFHAAVIGDEIVRYQEISTAAPWKLTGCSRGAFGTRAAAHAKGETIGKLIDHGYWTFLGDAGLNDEIAKTLAHFCNETGMKRIAFDGIEGVGASGMGEYSLNRMVNIWYENLKPESKGTIHSESSVPTHFNWHAQTNCNWGEPWYAGFRESQLYLRLLNQDFFRRNYIPCMLGSFRVNIDASVEDAEWVGARAAGHDAGFDIAFLGQETPDWGSVRRNFAKDEILEAIKNWEAARMAGAFSTEQKQLMRRMDHEFHIESAGKEKWRLFPFKAARAQIDRLPGAELRADFEFDNPYQAQSPLLSVMLFPDGSWPLVERFTIAVNGGEPFEIPVKLEPFQTLKLNSEGELRIYSRTWELCKTLKLTRPIPVLAQGKNRIAVDSQMTRGGKAALRIEVKTAGEPELAVAKAVEGGRG